MEKDQEALIAFTTLVTGLPYFEDSPGEAPRTHQVNDVPPRTYDVNEVRPGSYVDDHVNLIHEEISQVRRHRHKEWASFTLPLCRRCLQECTRRLHVRYPVAAVDPETCQCPCRVIEVAA